MYVGLRRTDWYLSVFLNAEHNLQHTKTSLYISTVEKCFEIETNQVATHRSIIRKKESLGGGPVAIGHLKWCLGHLI